VSLPLPFEEVNNQYFEGVDDMMTRCDTTQA